MDDTLTLNDIDEKVRNDIYKQDYSSKSQIHGVKILTTTHFVSDEGDFSELIRLDENGCLELMPEFKLAQINRTHIFPNSIKAWHLHFKQDEIWYVPPYFQLFAGLWDVRAGSPTVGQTMRINLGGNISRFLFIPKGVAHGSANFSYKSISLYYFVNQKFNPHDPDEQRIHWDKLGKEFWQPERD